MSEEPVIRTRQPPPRAPLPPEERPEAVRQLSIAVYAQRLDTPNGKGWGNLVATYGEEKAGRFAGSYDTLSRVYIRAMKAAGWTPPAAKE